MGAYFKRRKVEGDLPRHAKRGEDQTSWRSFEKKWSKTGGLTKGKRKEKDLKKHNKEGEGE